MKNTLFCVCRFPFDSYLDLIWCLPVLWVSFSWTAGPPCNNRCKTDREACRQLRKEALQVSGFDWITLEFRDVAVTGNVRLVAYLELDEVLKLTGIETYFAIRPVAKQTAWVSRIAAAIGGIVSNDIWFFFMSRGFEWWCHKRALMMRLVRVGGWLVPAILVSE